LYLEVPKNTVGVGDRKGQNGKLSKAKDVGQDGVRKRWGKCELRGPFSRDENGTK